MEDLFDKIFKESQGLQAKSGDIFDRIFAESKSLKPKADLSFGGILGKAKEALVPYGKSIGEDFLQMHETGRQKILGESEKQELDPRILLQRVLEGMKPTGPEPVDKETQLRMMITEKKIPGWIDEQGKPHLGERAEISPTSGPLRAAMAFRSEGEEEKYIPVASPFIRQAIINAINTGTFGIAEKIQPGLTMGAEGLEPTLAGQLGARTGSLISFIWGGPMKAGHLAAKLITKGAQRIFPWLTTADKAAQFTNRLLSGTASLSAASAAEQALQGPEAALQAAKEGGVAGAVFTVVGLIDPKSKFLGQVLRQVGGRALLQVAGQYDVQDFREIPDRFFTEAFNAWFLRRGVSLKKSTDYVKLQDILKHGKLEVDNLNAAGRGKFGDAWRPITFNPMMIEALQGPGVMKSIQEISRNIMSDKEYIKATEELPPDHPLALLPATYPHPAGRTVLATSFEVGPTGRALPTLGGLKTAEAPDILAGYRAAEGPPGEIPAERPVAGPAPPPPAPEPTQAAKRARPRGEALAPTFLTAADIGPDIIPLENDFKGFSIVWNKPKAIKGGGTWFEVLANFPGRAQESLGWMTRPEIKKLGDAQRGILAEQNRRKAPAPMAVEQKAPTPEAPVVATPAEAPKTEAARAPGSSEIPRLVEAERKLIAVAGTTRSHIVFPFAELKNVTDALEAEFRKGNPDVTRKSGRDGYSYEVERPYGKFYFSGLGEGHIQDLGFSAEKAKAYFESKPEKVAEPTPAPTPPSAPAPKTKPAWVGPYEELIDSMRAAFRDKATGKLLQAQNLPEGDREDHVDIVNREKLPRSDAWGEVKGYERGFVAPDGKFISIAGLDDLIKKTRAPEAPALTLEQEAEAPPPLPKAAPVEQPKLAEEPKAPPAAYPKPFNKRGTMRFANLNKWAENIQPLVEDGWVIEYGHRMGANGWARIIEKRDPGQGQRISAGALPIGEATAAATQLGLSEEASAKLPFTPEKKGKPREAQPYASLRDLVNREGGISWDSIVKNRLTGEVVGVVEDPIGRKLIKKKKGTGQDINRIATAAKKAGFIADEEPEMLLAELEKDVKRGPTLKPEAEARREAGREEAYYERAAEKYNQSIADEVAKLKGRLDKGEKWEDLDSYEQDLLKASGEEEFLKRVAPKEEVEAEFKGKPEVTRDTIEDKLNRNERLTTAEEAWLKKEGILEEVEARPAEEPKIEEELAPAGAKVTRETRVRKVRVTMTLPDGNAVEEVITEDLVPDLQMTINKLNVGKSVKLGTPYEGKWLEGISPREQLRFLTDLFKDIKKPERFWKKWIEASEAPIKGGVAYGQVLPKHISNINMARVLDSSLEAIGPNYDTKKFMADLIERYEGEVEKARGEPISLERTGELAEALNIPVETLVSSLRRKTKNLHVYINAARDALVTSALKMKSLSEAYSITRTPENLAKFTLAVERHRMIQREVVGGTAETGRALGSLRRYSEGKNLLLTKQYEQILKRLGKAGVTDEIARRMALLNMDNPLEVIKFIREVEPAKTKDKVYEVWLNWGLLSGPKTHIRNITSNAITAMMAPFEKAYAATIDYIGHLAKGRERAVFFKEVPAEFFGMIQGIPEGVRRALYAWQNEITMAGASKLEHTTKAAIKGELGRKVRWPGRALIMADEFFKGIIYSGQIHTLAYRQGLSEGKRGEALKSRVSELVADPTGPMKERATAVALKRTFQAPLGPGGESFLALRERFWPMKFIAPFIRTPTNIVKYALERTPLNLARMRKMKLAGELTPPVFAEEMAKVAFGASVAAGIAALFAQGKVSGGGPKNKEDREALYRTGWMPYSLKIGDKWYQYGALEPYGMLLGIITDTCEAVDYIGERPLSEITAKIALSVANNLTSKTYVKGLTDALNAVQDFDRHGKTWIEHLAGTAIPAAVAQANRAADPYMREVRSFLDYFKSRIPGVAQALPVKRDIYGKPVEKTGGIVTRLLSPVEVSREKGTDLDRELLRLDVAVGRPQITMGKKGEEKRLSPKQYDEYSVLIGQEVEKWLESIIKNPAYAKLSDDEKKDTLESALIKARNKARRMFIGKYREFAG